MTITTERLPAASYCSIASTHAWPLPHDGANGTVFVDGYIADHLEVHWQVKPQWVVYFADGGTVEAKLEVDLGGGFTQIEDYIWAANQSFQCANDQGIFCVDHVKSVPLNESQSTAAVKVRVTLTARMAQCVNCTGDPSSVGGTIWVYDVRIIAKPPVVDGPVALTRGDSGAFEVKMLGRQPKGVPHHVIDLTAIVNPEVGASTGMRSDTHGLRVRPAPPVPSDMPQTPQPHVIVTLHPDSPTTFVVGNSFVYSIYLFNPGPDALKFPQLTDATTVDDRMSGAVAASASLTFNDRILGRQTLGAVLLYGADDIPGSIVTIEPRHTVEVRIPAVWQIHSVPSSALPDHWSRRLTLAARVDLSPVSGKPISATSVNRWPVELQR